MIRSWRERIGLFIGGLFGQRGVGSAVVPATPDVVVRFSLGLTRSTSNTLFIDQTFKMNEFIARTRSVEVQI